MDKKIKWPEGKKFAFTVFDDTDRATVSNVSEVYRLLYDLGMKTTKSVWPIRGKEKPTIPGDTCEDEDYREWTLSLAQQGFEIAYHNATFHGVERSETERALDRFAEIYGAFPTAAANHADNNDALYWGEARLDGINKFIYRALQGFSKNRFFGHVEGDPRFWGDLCKERIRYVRNFVFNEINTLKVCPYMPYYDPARPYVNQWFASAEGASVDSFNATISEQNQDQLCEEGGACIMYTHFAKGFQEDGSLNPRFKDLMTRLADLDGWYVPTTTLLDFLAQQGGPHTISGPEKSNMERKWLIQRISSRF